MLISQALIVAVIAILHTASNCFEKSAEKFRNHIETGKHRKNAPKDDNPGVQLTLEEAIIDSVATGNVSFIEA